MSDDNTASKNYYRRIAQELAEFDTPQARYQAVLDRHWESVLAQDEPDGPSKAMNSPRYAPRLTRSKLRSLSPS